MARPIKNVVKAEEGFNNKNVIQSYLLTEAKYKFSVDEKRIMYRLIEIAQAEINGLMIKDNMFRCNKGLWDVEIEMPYSAILGLGGENNEKNHEHVKKAARALAQKLVEIEDTENKQYWCSSIIHSVHCNGKKGSISFKVDDFLWTAILDFSKGFRKYELMTAMKFKSPYTMRFYELMAGQSLPFPPPPKPYIAVEDLKALFGVKNKYKQTADFRKKVIEPAKRELDESSPYSFNFIEKKEGNKVVGFKFYPIHNLNVEDPELYEQKMQAIVTAEAQLSEEAYDYLRYSLGFSVKEINQNKKTFIEGERLIPDFVDFLGGLHRGARNAAKPQGYVVNAVKKKSEQMRNGIDRI